jgi:tetratricopeptide (TPR) repeat protein
MRMMLYGKKLKLNKEYTDPYMHLATIYKSQNKIQEAKETYEKLIESNSYYIDSYLNLGDLYSNEGKHFEAISIIQKLNKLNPNVPEAQYNLGTYYLFVKNYQKAEDHLMHAINLNPEYSNPYVNLAKVFESQGLFYKSLSAYRKAVALKKSYSDHTGMNSSDSEYFFDYFFKHIFYFETVLTKIIDSSDKPYVVLDVPDFTVRFLFSALIVISGSDREEIRERNRFKS